ncbi:MAG: TonB-dependent receptor, partial [Saprospiraceae bacterium]|nr:TonB-dependent receptor [Saprospiraceae bacterium]
TPTHKLGLGLSYSKNKFFGSLFGRWVDQYDFFSGINVAAKTNTDLIYAGSPVVEGARVGRSFNFGPLGGFFNLDLAIGYKINDYLSVAGQVVNVLDQEVREFVASPAIAPLYSLEVKINLPAIGGKK